MSVSEEMIRAVYRRDRSTLEELLRREDINAVDEDGRSVLMHAVLAEEADPQLISYLIGRGAALDAVDAGQRWTALHFAARDQKEEVVRVLLEGGAVVDARDAFGNTPLWRCVMNPQPKLTLVRLLLRHGADPRAENQHGVTPFDTARNMGNQGVAQLLTKAVSVE